MKRVQLGISACLLGERVRYDGGHKLDPFLVDTLGKHVEYVRVCPEVECGLPVPRESMRLEGDAENPRLVTTRTRRDLTDQMLRWARRRVVELEKEELAGFIFKGNSPSSGMRNVRVYNSKGVPGKIAVGLFARAFMEHFPLLPVEDDGRLHDPGIRENFIERVFTLQRWREATAGRKAGKLAAFHAEHKLLLLAHSPKYAAAMGRLVAGGKTSPARQLLERYEAMLTAALRLPATVQRHCNVLQHILGYFKKHLSPDEKQELLERIEQYRRGTAPLIVPITLVNHYVRKYAPPYLERQVYLRPHPAELALRNHV
ncbi:MAG: DUF523 and DUF1722 domain-containing protein [Planctomycetota bacterium]